MIEQIPTWLKFLLAKYGEQQGPLIGVEKEISGGFDSETVETSELSNLLEQMAESPAPIPTERTGTSVEWGQPTTSNDSIDDLLASFEATPDDYNLPSYELEPSGDEEDVPDWLSEALDTPPTITEMPDSETSLESPTTPASGAEKDVPDWLSEALDAPPTMKQEQQPSPLPTGEPWPGWLEETRSQASGSEEPVEMTTETDDFEAPAWLTEDLPPVDTPLPTSAVSESPAVTPEVSDRDVPDWIAEDLDSAGAEDTTWQASQETTAVSGADIPDWIDSLTEAELPEAPDWLMASDEAPPPSAQIDEPSVPDETASPIERDWLEDLDDSSIQVEEIPSPSTPEPTAGPGDQSWLSDLRAAIPADEPSPQDTDELFEDENLAIPAWLAGDEPASVADVEPGQAEIEPEIPAWLSSSPEMGSELFDTPQESELSSETEVKIPAWLTDEPTELVGAEASPEQTDIVDEGETETPDWLPDLSDVEDEPGVIAEETTTLEEEAELPDWLSESSQTPDTGELEVVEQGEPETPNWLMEAEEATETAVEEAPETPDWLSGLRQVETTAAADETLGLETTDRLADLSQADLRTTPEEKISEPETPTSEIDIELGAPDWLTDADQLEAEVATDTESKGPDWLNELSSTTTEVTTLENVEEVAETEETDAPAWLIEEAAAELAVTEQTISVERDEAVEETVAAEVAEEELAVEAPVQPEEPTVPPAAEEETQAPSWLADLRQAEAQTTEMVSADAVSDEMDELPAWLTDLPEVSDTDEALAETTHLPDEVESPEWLPEKTDDATTAGEETFVVPAEIEDEAETEIPSWLTDLPDVEEETTTKEQTITEDEVEPPAWLTDLRQADTEAAATAPADESAETEAPDWLSELPQAPGTGELETAEAASEMPDWLTETMEAPQEVALTSTEVQETEEETPPGLVELPEIEEETASSMEPIVIAEAEDVEAPDWLMELPQAPDAGQLESEATTEAELEGPDWLSELPPAPDTGTLAAADLSETDEQAATTPEPSTAEPETPSWLTGLRQAEAETRSDAEAIDLETPDWLAAEPAEAIVSEDETVEAEAPDWLAELPQAPDTGELKTAQESELETPDWLMETGANAEIEVEAEAETPARLTEELTETPVTETAGPVPVATDEAIDLEKPAWLDELSGTEGETDAAKEDASAAEAMVVEEASEPSDWLAGLRQAEDTATEDETLELETPGWLDELTEEADTVPETVTEGTDEAVDVIVDEETPLLSVDVVAEAEIEAPDWLAELSEEATPETTIAETDTATVAEPETPAKPMEADLEAELDLPEWLVEETPEVAIDEAAPTSETTDEAELPLPAWLDETTATESLTELEALEPTAEEADASAELGEETLPPPPDWMTGLQEATEAVKAGLPPEQAETVDTLTIADEAVEEPPKSSDDDQMPAAASLPEEQLDFDAPVETPDWLKDLDKATTEPIEERKIEEEDIITLPPTTTPPPTETEKAERPSTSGWLQALRSSERKADIEAEDNEVVESTGVLTGLTPLLPAEKLETPAAATSAALLTGSQSDRVLVATRQFYTIATQAPQLATLPEPLTQPRQLLGNLPRLGVFLLFIVLIALPLLPGLRAADSNRGATWTEPVGELSETLDRQRRQLISEPLGIIDQQQPESVALVSFDFTTATQGEMQPLAEAIIGRLKGQGMRLVFVSLEPEGATLAQQMIDQLLPQRDETYGDSVVNLGYIPGQVAGIRNLVAGQTTLATLKDFKEGVTFASAKRANWSDIKNLGQVDLVVTIADNPATARWWVEQMGIASAPDDGERFLLAATSATAAPFLQPYQANHQLDGLIAGINGAAAIEAGRREFGPARQMLDSQSIAHLFIVIVIAAGTIAGWMPSLHAEEPTAQDTQFETSQTEEGG